MIETKATFLSASWANTLRAVVPSLWPENNSPTITIFVSTFLAALVPVLFYLVVRRIRMQRAEMNPFRFMDLPPELRDMVYENLLEDPYYPPPPTCTKHAASPFHFLFAGRQIPSMQPYRKKKCNWILIANKQTYAEYMDILTKRSTFHLTVSPANYPNAKANTSASSASASTPSDKKIWQISQDTLKKLRKCDIKLITTSNMLGVSDPRSMPPASWALASQIKSELRDVTNVKELNLHVKAIGDPLWNPLWVWYHATQSFIPMGTPSPSSPNNTSNAFLGPKFNKISFSLDTWSPGENYLERDEDGKWAWYCMKGHCLGADGGPDMTVREFCVRLYLECRACRPELESEDEEDWALADNESDEEEEGEDA